MKTKHRTWNLLPFVVVLAFTLISSHSWAVYGVPIINLKQSEILERGGKYLQAAAARELGIDKTTIWRKCESLGIHPPNGLDD